MDFPRDFCDTINEQEKFPGNYCPPNRNTGERLDTWQAASQKLSQQGFGLSLAVCFLGEELFSYYLR